MPGVASRLAPGTKLGPYELRSLLGAGGMGAVYRAHDLRLGRDVAIKVLPDGLRVDPTFKARFEREARAAAAINHPNVMALYDVGTEEGVPYLVCELLDGETIRQKLAHGPAPGGQALDWARQIARGLVAAHERGLIHRDLKPGNLLVTRDGIVKILDFGLAKLAPAPPDDTAPAGAEAPAPPALSESGAVVGTLAYMAPEQVIGKAVDRRADLFAFGVVLHEMISGRPPFAGDSAPEMAFAILSDDPPALPPDAPPGVERFIRHCLEKDPAARFQTARDLLFALESLPAPPPVAAPARRRSMTWIAALLAAIAAAFIAGRLLPRPGIGPAGLPPPRFEQITFNRPAIGQARFLGDGRGFVFDTWKRDQPVGVWLGRIGKPETTLLIPDVVLVAVSRSDELLILRAPHPVSWPILEGTLARADASGGAARDVAEHVTSADWSPDGRELALVRRDGDRQVLEYRGRALFESTNGLGPIRFAPDGAHIAFVEYATPGDDRGRVAVVDLEAHVRRLTAEYYAVHGIAWSPDGHELIYSAGATILREVHAVTLDGVERTVVSGADALDAQDATRDGGLLVKRGGSHVYFYAHGPGATDATELSLSEFDVVSDVSPDGRWVAVDVQGRNATDEYQVYVRPIGGGPATLLGDGDDPAFSLDGRWIVASSHIDRARLTLLPVGPGTTRTLPAGSLAERRWPAFAGSDRIVFSGREPGGQSRLYVEDLAGGQPRPFSPEGVDQIAAVAPDGLTVVARAAKGKFVYVSTVDGEQRNVPGLDTDDRPIQWSADGRSLYVYAKSAAGHCVDLVDVATGRRTRWRELGNEGIGGHPFFWTWPPTISRNGEAWVSSFFVAKTDLYLVSQPRR